MTKEIEIEELLKSKFLSPEKFALDIEQYIRDNNCDYIDGIRYYCEDNNIEIETVSKLMSKPLKEKLKQNAIKLNLLKKTNKTKSVV